MTENDYQAAKAKMRAAYTELARVPMQRWGPSGTKETAVTIHRAELDINERILQALVEMRDADTQPNALDFPGSPYTRSQVYETGIAEATERIEDNKQSINRYS